MGKPENELGGVHVHIPEGAKLNIENKDAPPPETKYEKRRANIDKNVTKKLCGGKYEQQGDN
jgi:hypothetical protein